MSQDDDLDNEINDAINKLFKEMMKDGKFPFQGKFSVMISGGRIPIDINPPNSPVKDCPEDCDGDCEDDCPHDSFSRRRVSRPHSGNRTHVRPSKINADYVEKTPYSEYYDYDGEIQVFVDLPGTDLSNTAISVTDGDKEDLLSVTAFTGDVRYSMVIRVSKIKKETMKYRSVHGTLTIVAKLADTETEANVNANADNGHDSEVSNE
ncbi:MAG: hypothetical protein IK060_02905 [Methanomicrobium sp.]|nr:hypothetical protein [Methanomicrobium sp.]